MGGGGGGVGISTDLLLYGPEEQEAAERWGSRPWGRKELLLLPTVGNVPVCAFDPPGHTLEGWAPWGLKALLPDMLRCRWEANAWPCTDEMECCRLSLGPRGPEASAAAAACRDSCSGGNQVRNTSCTSSSEAMTCRG